MNSKYAICYLINDNIPYRTNRYRLSVVDEVKYLGATMPTVVFTVGEILRFIKNKTLLLRRRFDHPIFNWTRCVLLWNKGGQYK